MSEFDMGQIVMGRWLGQSISKTLALVRWSLSAVASIYQTQGEHWLTRAVWSNKRATVAQITEKHDVCFDRKMSGYTAHRSLLCIGVHSPSWVQSAHADSCQLPETPTISMWASEIDQERNTSCGLTGMCASLSWRTSGTKTHCEKKAACPYLMGHGFCGSKRWAHIYES